MRIFHYYARKPSTLNEPGNIGNLFMEPFYATYCNAVRSAAAAGFFREPEGTALRDCAAYSAHPRRRRCADRPATFAGGRA